MRFSNILLSIFAAVGSIAPAWAQETDPPQPITVSGSASVASDYRFRGVSQSDKEVALQGGITIAHESGFYIATWGSNLAGWGTFGGANIELDLVAGYKGEVGNAAYDVGVTWYTYPGGADETDVVELYGKVSGTAGPANLTAASSMRPSKRRSATSWRTPTAIATTTSTCLATEPSAFRTRR